MNEDIRAKIEKYKQLRTASNELYNELNGVVESVITRYLALVAQDEAGQHAMNVSTAARYRHEMQIWAWSFTDDGIQVTYRHSAINEAYFIMDLHYLTDPNALDGLADAISRAANRHNQIGGADLTLDAPCAEATIQQIAAEAERRQALLAQATQVNEKMGEGSR